MRNFLIKFLKLGNFSFVESFYQKFSKNLLFFMIFFLIIGSILIFFTEPDYLQGHSAKIMYAHIPSAWLSLILYFISSVGIILYFSYKNLFFAFFSYSVAISGCFFSLLCLLSGMIWGKLTWGVWWAWDPRLTSMLILCIFYFIFIYLFAIVKSEKTNDFKIPGIVNLIGIINLPIIKFSVEFYNSLHQKSSIIRKGGMSIYGGLSRPLWFFFGAFIIFACLMIILNLKSELFLLKQNRKKIS